MKFQKAFWFQNHWVSSDTVMKNLSFWSLLFCFISILAFDLKLRPNVEADENNAIQSTCTVWGENRYRKREVGALVAEAAFFADRECSKLEGLCWLAANSHPSNNLEKTDSTTGEKDPIIQIVISWLARQLTLLLWSLKTNFIKIFRVLLIRKKTTNSSIRSDAR
jgi:hypothetical protein